MKKNVLGMGLLLIFSGAVFGQQALEGKYSGHYVFLGSRGEINHGLTLEIASTEGGAVKGTATRMATGARTPCNGKYAVEGTLKDNQLNLRSLEKGGAASDCNVNLRLTVEGNKLVGTLGSLKTELTRQ
jgi:hypothetical protein